MSVVIVSPARSSDTMELLLIEVDASANWLISSQGRIQGDMLYKKRMED